MESEIAKEIKECLQSCNDDKMACYDCKYYEKCEKILTKNNLLTLINELESENERLSRSDTSKEESSIEYYNLYKDLKRKNKDLNELCELQRVSIAENFVKENQLKDRIAELEDKIENGTLVEPPVIDMFEEIPFDKVDKTEFANTIAQETAEGIISDLKNYIAEYGHITKSMLDELAEKYILRYGVEVEDES